MATGHLSTAGEPAAAYRPFDKGANGYVPGEGGAILLVESSERAGQRKAPQIYAEIAGYGASHDAYHWGKPAPDGRQLARAISVALADADVSAADVDVVFADASGVPDFDAIEVSALKNALGKRASEVPVTAPKSMVGRLYAGGAALDTAAAALAMRDGVIPPTINLEDPADGFDLDFVTEARQAQLSTVLLVARGYGGFNAALVLRAAG